MMAAGQLQQNGSFFSLCVTQINPQMLVNTFVETWICVSEGCGQSHWFSGGQFLEGALFMLLLLWATSIVFCNEQFVQYVMESEAPISSFLKYVCGEKTLLNSETFKELLKYHLMRIDLCKSASFWNPLCLISTSLFSGDEKFFHIRRKEKWLYQLQVFIFSGEQVSTFNCWQQRGN